MADGADIRCGVVIFGGGAAGLWVLDDLRRAGYAALLLEAEGLGTGQTISSQGIIHGGVKYALSGLLSASARAIREMPERWRRSLAGEMEPDLRGVRRRAEYCHLWRTDSVRSKLGMLGARKGLRIQPHVVPEEERPVALRSCPGIVARLDEQVIEPGLFLSVLADRHRECILQIDGNSGLEMRQEGGAMHILLLNPETGEPLTVAADRVILAAGAGNRGLRRMAGLADNRMQKRPLHMVMARGALPELNGHCVDGRATRVTITTTADYTGRRVWQIGGAVAERGVNMMPPELVDLVKRELTEVLPGVDLGKVEWGTWRVDRAELRKVGVPGGGRPEYPGVLQEGNVLTCWPTKLALAPVMAEEVRGLLEPPSQDSGSGESISEHELIVNWPRPDVAWPPWERQELWIAGH